MGTVGYLLSACILFVVFVCAVGDSECGGAHASLVCGIVWLIVLIIRSLLRIPGAEYIYLFIRYADGQNPVWVWNKCIVTVIGICLWGIIYLKCRRMPQPFFP